MVGESACCVTVTFGGSVFLSDSRISIFVWFGSRFPFVDQGDRSQHRLDVLERLGTSSGAHPWPDFLTFIVHMVIGFLSVFRIFGFLWFES